MRTLTTEHSRQILEACRHGVSAAPRRALRQLVALIGRILDVKAAYVVNVDGTWTIWAESRAEPRLEVTRRDVSVALNRLAGTRGDAVQAWSHERVDWTLIDSTGLEGLSGAFVLEGDWTGSAPTLLLLAQSLQFAWRMRVPSVAATAHRLTRRLGRVVGLKPVCAVVLDHVARAVSSRLATFAVPSDKGDLVIVATHGYPVALVDRIRILPGSSVIGYVYESRLPLCVADVGSFSARQRPRRRYRTNSFAAVPVSAGSEVLGVMCVADRLDERPFTRDDLSMLRALAAPAALALARERARRVAEELERVAIIDPLSGLFNRGHFSIRLDEELERAHRQKSPVALMMIDVDDFKGVNDRFGHMAGDAVIRGVAEILRHAVRKSDLCARFGGEEFAIVMPGSAAENAMNVAGRIRQRIEAFRPDEREWSDLSVTASIGISVGRGLPGRTLVDQADRALYAAKRAGKNRVMGWVPKGPGSPG